MLLCACVSVALTQDPQCRDQHARLASCRWHVSDGTPREDATPTGDDWLTIPQVLKLKSVEPEPERLVLTAPVWSNSPEFRQYPPQRGMHVVKQLGGGLVRIYQNADAMSKGQLATFARRTSTISSLRSQLEAFIPALTQRDPLQQPWRFFDPADGAVLTTLQAIKVREHLEQSPTVRN